MVGDFADMSTMGSRICNRWALSISIVSLGLF